MILTVAFVSHLYVMAEGNLVSISLQDAPLTEALNMIERQSGYYKINHNSDDLSKYKVTASIENKEGREAVDCLIAGLPVKVKSKGRFLTVSKNDENEVTAPKRNETGRKEISGTVTDKDGEPLAGVTIKAPGDKYAVTDVDGSFTMPSDHALELTFTYVGMKDLKIKAEVGVPLKVIMMDNPQLMDEIVVTGYQNMKRENATGAFQNITAKDLETRYMSDLSSNLEGKVAGMVVGDNGIQIRGTGTLNASKNPLVVVDGLPISGGLSDINPYDVEKITVLKDAAAAAVYGARASNGVIVVTTKKALAQKTVIDFNADFTVYERRDFSDYNLVDASGLIDLEQYNFNWIMGNEDASSYLENQYARRGGTWKPLNKLLAGNAFGDVTDQELAQNIAAWRKNSYTNDWRDYMEHTRFEQNYNLSIRSKTSFMSNNISVNWRGDNTSMKNEYDNKLSLRYIGEITPVDWFNAEVGLQLDNSRQKSHYTGLYDPSSYSSFPEYLGFRDSEGKPSRLQAYVDLNEPSLADASLGLKDEGYIPLQELNLNFSKSRETYTRAFAHLNFFPIKELKLSGMFQYEDVSGKVESLTDGNSYSARHLYNLFTLDGKHNLPEGGIMESRNSSGNYYTFRIQASYDKVFNDLHEINALAGYEFRQTDSKWDENTTYGYDEQTLTASNGIVNFYDLSKQTKTDLGSLYTAENAFIPSSLCGFDHVRHRYLSYYANAFYTFDRRYNVSGSFRIDKADLFGADKKFRRRPLWSVGASWNAHNESFLRDQTWISILKPRFSYGVTGNINSNYTSYLTASIYTNSLTGDRYASVNTPPNDQLRWEKTRTLDIGIEFAFFNYRINGSIDYYDKKGSDVLSLVDIDPTNGWSSLRINNAGTRNRGFELQVNGEILRDIDPSQIGLDAEFTIAYNNNKITKLNHVPTSGYSALTAYTQGYPVNSLFSYKFDHLERDSEGYQQIYWQKGDGSVSQEDLYSSSFTPADVVFSGTLDPKWSGSFTPRITWHNFSLSAMTAFYLGHYFRNDLDHWTYSMGTSYGNSAPKAYLEYWKASEAEKDNMIGNGYMMSNTDMYYSDVKFSDRNVDHADYFKIRNIVLTYNFPTKICKKIGASSLRLRAQMNNVATWARNEQGVDPERVDHETGAWRLRTPRSYTFGLYISF